MKSSGALRRHVDHGSGDASAATLERPTVLPPGGASRGAPEKEPRVEATRDKDARSDTTAVFSIDHAVTDRTILSMRARTLRDVAEAAVRGGTSLSGADLAHVNLRGAQLRGAGLANAVLLGADLLGADLSDATLLNAKIEHGKLVGTWLHGADLRGASLLGADLTSADLTGADLTGTNLCLARLASAIMPDGRAWEAFRKDPLLGIKGSPDVVARIRTAAFVAVFEADLL